MYAYAFFSNHVLGVPQNKQRVGFVKLEALLGDGVARTLMYSVE